MWMTKREHGEMQKRIKPVAAPATVDGESLSYAPLAAHVSLREGWRETLEP